MSTKNNTLTAKICADFLQYELVGDSIPLDRIAALSEDCKGAVKFVTEFSQTYLDLLNSNPSNFIIAHKDYETKLKVSHILSDNPRLDFCKIANRFFPRTRTVKIEKTAIIGSDVEFGENIYIGHNTVIEDRVKIGSNTTILHNVVISENCIVGSNCMIKSGSVIGQRGFGFERDHDGKPISFPHYGRVIIGDYVEIGALNTVAAGALSNTTIEDHVKTDDHVHIAHNVHVGWGTLITACAEISGSVHIGERAWLGPNCAIIDKISIGAEAFIGIGAVIIKTVPESVVIAGNSGKILTFR